MLIFVDVIFYDGNIMIPHRTHNKRRHVYPNNTRRIKQTRTKAKNHNKMRRGGSSALTPLPPPFIGDPWKSNVGEWPGVDGVPGNRNYYSLCGGSGAHTRRFFSKKRPQRVRSSKTVNKKHRGGSNEINNIGRNIMFNIKSMYNLANAEPRPVDPSPYKDQYTNV